MTERRIQSRATVFRWPDPSDGPWFLGADLARVDGRTVVVGLSIRSYATDAEVSSPDWAPPTQEIEWITPGLEGQDRTPGPSGLIELNHTAIRNLKMGEIADQARQTAAVVAAAEAAHNSPGDFQAELLRRLAPLMQRDEPRQRRPKSGPDQLEQVAQLYREGLAKTPRTPAKYVEDRLNQTGVKIDGSAVRKLVARARRSGLLPASERRAGQ